MKRSNQSTKIRARINKIRIPIAIGSRLNGRGCKPDGKEKSRIVMGNIYGLKVREVRITGRKVAVAGRKITSPVRKIAVKGSKVVVDGRKVVVDGRRCQVNGSKLFVKENSLVVN